MTPCAYCGDEATFSRINGTGPFFCKVCCGLAANEVEPNSLQHRMLRPYSCTYCSKPTAAIGPCARCSHRQPTGDNN